MHSHSSGMPFLLTSWLVPLAISQMSSMAVLLQSDKPRNAYAEPESQNLSLGQASSSLYAPIMATSPLMESELPNEVKLKTDSELPSLEKDRSDTELPNTPWSKTEAELPNLEYPRKESELPIAPKLRIEAELPSLV